MLRDIFSKQKEAAIYKKITAKALAEANGIEYIRRVTVWAKNDENGFYARKGMYILLHPVNDGHPFSVYEWYSGDGKFIMDNQSSFKGITNLSEIIMQMIELYTKYIDEDVFIESFGFAIKLEDKICPDYQGRASLVFTKDSIRNSKVEPEHKLDAKKYFVNDFLDHYIGWNFGTVVKSNSELEKALIDFNNLVISRGLRMSVSEKFEGKYSVEVMPYKLKVS